MDPDSGKPGLGGVRAASISTRSDEIDEQDGEPLAKKPKSRQCKKCMGYGHYAKTCKNTAQ